MRVWVFQRCPCVFILYLFFWCYLAFSGFIWPFMLMITRQPWCSECLSLFSRRCCCDGAQRLGLPDDRYFTGLAGILLLI